MAQNTKSKELRQQAVRKLTEGRAEMRAELHQARQQLSPSRVLKRLYNRHARLMLTLAVTAGALSALLFFRSNRTAPSVATSEAPPPPKPVLATLLIGGLAMAARSITPALIKTTIIPHLLSFLSKRQQTGASIRPPD